MKQASRFKRPRIIIRAEPTISTFSWSSDESEYPVESWSVPEKAVESMYFDTSVLYCKPLFQMSTENSILLLKQIHYMEVVLSCFLILIMKIWFVVQTQETLLVTIYSKDAEQNYQRQIATSIIARNFHFTFWTLSSHVRTSQDLDPLWAVSSSEHIIGPVR
jgi:hypothetical protein